METRPLVDLVNKLIEESKEYRPLVVEWDITYRCPFSCVHCLQKNNRHIEELNKEIIFRMIDELTELGTIEYKISGGDPLIRSDIFEILKYIKQTNARVVVYTSGYYLTDEICEKLSRLDVTRVETTLLGTDAETHDSLSRCPGGFNKICRGIRKLNDLGVPQKVKYIQMQQNFSQTEKIASLAEGLGVEIYPSPYLWCPIDSLESEIEPYRLTKDELTEHYRLYPQLPIEKTFLNCGAGKYLMGISADGKVMPCAVFSRNYAAGNISELSMKDIWNNSELLKGFRGKIRYPIFKCRVCETSEFCILCPGVASWANKNVFEPYEPMCHYAQIAKKAYEETH